MLLHSRAALFVRRFLGIDLAVAYVRRKRHMWHRGKRQARPMRFVARRERF